MMNCTILFDKDPPFLSIHGAKPLEEPSPIPILAVPDAVPAGFAFGVDEYFGSGIGQETDRGSVAVWRSGRKREVA